MDRPIINLIMMNFFCVIIKLLFSHKLLEVSISLLVILSVTNLNFTFVFFMVIPIAEMRMLRRMNDKIRTLKNPIVRS